MKTYSLKQLQTVVNWVQPKKTAEVLAEHGIHPSSELVLGARTYRQYDEAAMKRAKVLRREHLQRINGQQVVEITPAAPTLEADQIERMTQVIAGIAARVAALTPLVERIDELHAKLDSLHDKTDRLAAVWDDTTESINEGYGSTQ